MSKIYNSKKGGKKRVKKCYKCGVEAPFLIENQGVFYCKKCYEERRLFDHLYFQMKDMGFAEKTIKKIIGV